MAIVLAELDKDGVDRRSRRESRMGTTDSAPGEGGSGAKAGGAEPLSAKGEKSARTQPSSSASGCGPTRHSVARPAE